MGSKWRACFELLRFPAVFTAVADVMMGYLVVRGDLDPLPVFALLVIASSCLYLSGMVLNDVYDAAVDASERPERPIPSGRITLAAASRLGWSLLAGGVGLVWLASLLVSAWVPGVVGILLAGGIWVYDSVAAKHASLAPIVMAMCRSLNVLLAMCVAKFVAALDGDPPLTESERMIGCVGVAFYIAGITWFARAEAGTSNRWQLIGAMITMLVGLAAYAISPFLLHSRTTLLSVHEFGWAVLWLAIAGVILRRCALAVANPEPPLVQIAVRSALRSLIVIDAAIVLGFCGAAWGWAVLALLVPMLLLERWSSTT